MPIGAVKQGSYLSQSNLDLSTGPIFRGYIRASSATVINYYNTLNTSLANFTHACGAVSCIKTSKLPSSNNQIVAISGASGRRILHLDTSTNTFTSIHNSTAITNVTSCDIHMNATDGRFYVVFSSSSSTSNQRMRMVIGTIATPTTNITSDVTLSNPGAETYTVAWNPQGTVLAARTPTTIRTYTRSGDTVSLFATTYSLAGGATNTGTEELSWNFDGTVLAAGNSGANTITRFNSAGDGSLPTSASFSVPGGGNGNIPAFNPISEYQGVVAISATAADLIKIMYFANDGTLLASPTTGFISTTLTVYQLRWSPRGDKLARLSGNPGSTCGVGLMEFTFNQNTATLSFKDFFTTAANTPAFDWIYF
jgi:hypothetical protein